ncbi:MAG: endolytic transglycosylase MltG [Nitrospinae bacterium]|nr:endolytic transglycosylase MltG [Nitrospinota bacterium]
MGRILGLDVGDVRIGAAISDELEITAQGLETIKRKGIENDIAGIKEVIALNNIEAVVVGLPKMMNGTIGIQAQKVIDFTNILKSKINIPVFFRDERLTTAEVQKRLIEADVRRNKRREVVDKLAAQLILQGYLDSRRIKGKSGFLRLAVVFYLLTFSLILILIIFVYIQNSINRPLSGIGNARIVYIPKGSNLKAVSSILKREGIIDNTFMFNLIARYRFSQGILKAGEYQITPDMSPLQVLDAIINGKVYQYSVTIPEGYNIFEIASLLHKKGLANKERFISLSFDREFIKSLEIVSAPSTGSGLEGYLFPNTYYFSKEIDESIIIKKMVDTFRNAVWDRITVKSREIGLTPHQIITLASLIEKETGREDEKPVISSVFHNRFKKKMRLQCDPTVIYALLLRDFKGGMAAYDGNIRKYDLIIDSPYNTYKYAGLPPGPIANPGKSSIEAAMFPDNSRYLYFVSKNDGGHYFSSSVEEHNRAVRIYQLKRTKT